MEKPLRELRMMCVFAHPDDESLGMGGTLAKYAAEGVELSLVTATRGEKGRWGEGQDPGPEAVGRLREAELREAARKLGIGQLHLLDYIDGELDKADPSSAVRRIVEHIRSFRPHVLVTFGPDGAYGHPDHIAISQLASAAVAAAPDPHFDAAGSSPLHQVSKLYYMAWSPGKWQAYQSAFRKLTVNIDGVERRAAPWPDWAITTVIDTEGFWPVAWDAVRCHRSQLALYGELDRLAPEHHRELWGIQQFYRVFSLVNGGRKRETDLFEGLREQEPREESRGSGRGGARHAPIDMRPAQFSKLGHGLVDQIAAFLDSIADRPVTRASTPEHVRSLLSLTGTVPQEGTDPENWLPQIARHLFEHSLHNGHPRFWGYITASPAPIGMLGDLLASAVNPNVGAWKLSPLASEIERETIRWISDLVGYRTDCGGLLVSGGNVANLVCFLTARRARWGTQVRENGIPRNVRPRVYASTETHTWIQKAADLAGLGTSAIRWIPVDNGLRATPSALRQQIEEDLARGEHPFLVVGTAGTVGTGAVDPLRELGSICREYQLWFHVDGAYGAPAAMVPGINPDLEALREADSIAVDPHKWLYLPLEAGCALVSSREALRDTFSYHPPYYHFDEELTNYFDLGIQNSRGFRALKVWMAIRQVGREGYRQMISEDIRLAREFYSKLQTSETLEPLSHGLSICTFRYVPPDLRPVAALPRVGAYLDELNRRTLTGIEESGEAFLSNAVVHGKFALRLCVVNFRTTLDNILTLPEIVERHGREQDRSSRRDLEASR